MKVSIITVCFNADKTIRRTIESVLSQSYLSIEYIIIDGGSTDSTLEIISEYEGVVSRLVSEPDNGIYDAMNKGVALATGDVVGILNSDDWFEDEIIISSIVEKFYANPDVELVFGDVVFSREQSPGIIARYYSSKNFRPWKLRFGWMPPHPATFIRRRVYEVYGLYSPDYLISSDYEMFVRLLLVNRLNYARIDKVLVHMQLGGVSTAGPKNIYLLNREIVRACLENGIYTNLIFILFKMPFKLAEFLIKPRVKK